MKYKKTTILGVVLSLVLVLGVTVAFASSPKAPAEGQDVNPNNNTPYEVCANPLCAVGYQHCHIDGQVVRAYDTYPGLLCAHPDCEMEEPHEHDGTQYAGRAGKYVILNSDPEPVESAPVSGGTVEYDGRTYNRAGLSAETLEWLDWYLALPEAEQLAVSYEPAELVSALYPDAEQGFTHDPNGPEDSAGAVACPVEGCTEVTAHQHNGRWSCFMYEPCPVEGCTVQGTHAHDGVVYSCNGAGHSVDGGCNGSCAIPVCPVEGCTVRGRHIHDGVAYRCGGDVCDGSCMVYGSGAAFSATPVSSGHHGGSHHGNGHH